MTDNFEQIKRLLKFEREFDLYHIMIIQRKKDNPNLNKSEIIIKRFNIYSINDLDKYKQLIIDLCKLNNARAYINLNIKSEKDISYYMNLKLAEIIIKGNFKKTKSLYDSCVNKTPTNKSKSYLILDIDEEDINSIFKSTNDIMDMEAFIIKCGGKIIDRIKTKSGIHLILKKSNFNIKMFKDKYTKVELKKNPNTILYSS